MDGKRKCVAEKRRPSKSIFDDEDNDSDEDIKVGKRTNTRISSESSQSTSTVSREYVSRGIQNLSESSSDSETDEPPNKRLSDINQSNSGVVDDSDDSSENDKVSEYFDFTEIISTQQKIKELEANKANEENGECSNISIKKQPGFCISEVKKTRTRKCKNVSTLKSKKQVAKNEDDDQIDVSELLAMGESKIGEPKSDDEQETASILSQDTVKKEIQVRIDLPSIVTKKYKKKFDIDAALKRRLNAVKRENQVFIHKVHILCLIAHWNMVDDILNSETLLGSALSIVPSEKFYPPKMATLEYLEKLVNWFTKKIDVSDKPPDNPKYLKESLLIQFSECKANSIKDKALMFVCIARVLGLKCRIMVNLQPVPLKPNREDLLVVKTKKDEDEEKDNDESDSSEDEFTEVVEVKTKTKGKEKKGANSEYFDKKTPNKSTAKDKKTPVKNETAKSKTSKKQEKSTKDAKSTSKAGSSKAGSSKAGSSKGSTPKKGATKDRRILSSDSDDLIIKKKKKKVGSDIWSEVFLEAEEKWISVDLSRGRIHCIEHIQSLCSQPVVYVIGWNGNRTFKDLTKRYAPQWMTTTRKHRVETDWWDETIAPWKPKRTAREKEEDYDLDKILEDKPLPAAISEYKNHPLYVLKRHLLKFEAIYPPDAPPIGYVKGEPVYSRLCVSELHSKETWMRQAKSIRLNEKAYKIVKARPKYDKLTGTIVSDLPLEIFGHWQVEDYQPPVAVDGVVPRNDWGNVELYKPSMLPIGTVHLQIPGLLRVAKKLKIDCAPALVGWEYNQGCSFPVMDGFVVCEEFKEVLLDNWNKSIDESAKRGKDKLEQRVYGNWKRLIKGLIIRERLEKKYNFGPLQDPKEKKKAPKRKHKK